MKACAHCSVEFQSRNKNAKFCSLSCFGKTNGRTKPSPEALQAMSAAQTARQGNRPKKTPMTRAEQDQLARDRARDAMMNAAWDDLGTSTRFKRVKVEQQHRCNHCDLAEWRGQPIPLEIEHKDGVRTNHARENLEAICPNCHAQTSTWRGRNKAKKVTDAEMIAAIRATPNITQALIKLGLAPKGGNFSRAKRLQTMV